MGKKINKYAIALGLVAGLSLTNPNFTKVKNISEFNLVDVVHSFEINKKYGNAYNSLKSSLFPHISKYNNTLNFHEDCYCGPIVAANSMAYLFKEDFKRLQTEKEPEFSGDLVKKLIKEIGYNPSHNTKVTEIINGIKKYAEKNNSSAEIEHRYLDYDKSYPKGKITPEWIKNNSTQNSNIILLLDGFSSEIKYNLNGNIDDSNRTWGHYINVIDIHKNVNKEGYILEIADPAVQKHENKYIINIHKGENDIWYVDGLKNRDSNNIIIGNAISINLEK
jgi:hypothetical protein